jgi:hypothetical protein
MHSTVFAPAVTITSCFDLPIRAPDVKDGILGSYVSEDVFVSIFRVTGYGSGGFRVMIIMMRLIIRRIKT